MAKKFTFFSTKGLTGFLAKNVFFLNIANPIHITPFPALNLFVLPDIFQPVSPRTPTKHDPLYRL
jgi:hypothetical protein